MTNQDLKSCFSTAVTEFFNTNPLNAFWKKAQNELDFCAQIQGVKVSIEFISTIKFLFLLIKNHSLMILKDWLLIKWKVQSTKLCHIEMNAN